MAGAVVSGTAEQLAKASIGSNNAALILSFTPTLWATALSGHKRANGFTPVISLASNLVADLIKSSDLDRVGDRVADPDAVISLLINRAGSVTYRRFVEVEGREEIGQAQLSVLVSTALCHAAPPTMTNGGVEPY